MHLVGVLAGFVEEGQGGAKSPDQRREKIMCSFAILNKGVTHFLELCGMCWNVPTPAHAWSSGRVFLAYCAFRKFRNPSIHPLEPSKKWTPRFRAAFFFGFGGGCFDLHNRSRKSFSTSIM